MKIKREDLGNNWEGLVMAVFLPSDSGEHFKLLLSSIILFIVVIV